MSQTRPSGSCPKYIFKIFAKQLGHPIYTFFKSRVSHQRPAYMSLKADPCCQVLAAFKQDCNSFFQYGFSFCNISKVLRQLFIQKLERMILLVMILVIMANLAMVSSPTIHVSQIQSSFTQEKTYVL